MNALILDMSVIFIFILFLILGFKSGVLKSFLSFVGAVAAIFLAVYCSGIVAQYIYRNFIEPSVISEIEKVISSGGVSADKILSKIPFFISGLLAKYSITSSSIAHIINNSSISELPQKLANAFYPTIFNTLKIIFTVILFILFGLPIKYVVRVVSKVSRLPVLKHANSILGGLLGLFKGYIVVALCMACINVFVPMSKKTNVVFSRENINSTVIFREIYNNNIVYGLFQKL